MNRAPRSINLMTDEVIQRWNRTFHLVNFGSYKERRDRQYDLDKFASMTKMYADTPNKHTAFYDVIQFLADFHGVYIGTEDPKDYIQYDPNDDPSGMDNLEQ